jgi:hypothetical protein
LCESWEGTAAKGGRFHYYTCQNYLKRGKAACNSRLLNKNKLEKAVLDQVQEQILSEDNVRRDIELVIDQTRSDHESSAEEKAILLAIADADAKLHRWEEALERGLLSLEDASHRIKELRHERAALLKTKGELAQKPRSLRKALPIPTPLMNNYIREMQERLRTNKIGYKKEFLREIIKEVRVKGREITLTYRLPIAKKPSSGANGGEFFTLLQMVEAGGIEPPSEGLRPNMTTCLADVLISLVEPPAAGSLGASRFGFQPHPLRQENQPIPLNDVLSNPVGESR